MYLCEKNNKSIHDNLLIYHDDDKLRLYVCKTHNK